MLAIARLQLRQVLGGRKLWLVVVVALLPVALTILMRTGGGIPRIRELELFTGIYLFVLYPQTLSIVIALLYGTSILNSEIHDRTLTYLFTRPIAKWRIIVAKYVVNVLVLIGISVPSLVISWLVLGTSGNGGLLLGQVIAVCGATIAYNAVFALCGLISSRRAMILGIGYAVAFEFVLSFVPAVVNTMTVTYYLRSVVVRASGVELPNELLRIVGDASILGSLAFPVGLAAIALVATSLIASRREFSIGDDP